MTLVVFVLGGADDAVGAGGLGQLSTLVQSERMQPTLLPTVIPVVRTCTCILHTARSLVFVVGDAGDAARAESVKPAGHTGGEGANAKNTGGDSDSSADLNESHVPRKSLMNTKPHAAILIDRSN